MIMFIKNEQGECLLQFGKVDDKTFHLDYKVGGRTQDDICLALKKTYSIHLPQAPFSAFSAFGAALCQVSTLVSLAWIPLSAEAAACHPYLFISRANNSHHFDGLFRQFDL